MTEGVLCSPGRWVPKRRKYPQGGAGLGALTRKLFLEWVSRTRRRREPCGCGEVRGIAFGKHMEVARKRLDDHLRSKGLRPERRKEDVECEINFRRLHAMLKLQEDEDYEYLEGVVASGVKIGVDMEMPRVPAVFEEKTKWKVEATEEDMHEILSQNYSSADENAADIARQVREELELGTIKKTSLEEARERYGDRLAIAALGAVPKDLTSDKVRMIHDGTYSVDVNRRIRVRDRLRFPLIDDATTVMAELEEAVQEEGGGIRFSMYDISRAHKLIPVVEEDWGLQAFRLPGTPEDEVLMHTRGTFGIASAAYWWGRCAAGIIRMSHRLSGPELALFHLLYADDGWLAATGTRFWMKLLLGIGRSASQLGQGRGRHDHSMDRLLPRCLQVRARHQLEEAEMDKGMDREEAGGRRHSGTRTALRVGATVLRGWSVEACQALPGADLLLVLSTSAGNLRAIPRCREDPAEVHKERGGAQSHSKSQEATRGDGGSVPCGREGSSR